MIERAGSACTTVSTLLAISSSYQPSCSRVFVSLSKRPGGCDNAPRPLIARAMRETVCPYSSGVNPVPEPAPYWMPSVHRLGKPVEFSQLREQAEVTADHDQRAHTAPDHRWHDAHPRGLQSGAEGAEFIRRADEHRIHRADAAANCVRSFELHQHAAYEHADHVAR